MTNIDKQLADLEELYKNGTITAQEYIRDKERIFANARAQNRIENPLGMDRNSYFLLMHLSQFAGFLALGLGFAAPIVMWVIGKDKDQEVDRHGKNILNFLISWAIYYVVALVLCFVLVGIPLLIVLAILQFIFIIIAAIKAYSNEFWKYPMSFPFFNVG